MFSAFSKDRRYSVKNSATEMRQGEVRMKKKLSKVARKWTGRFLATGLLLTAAGLTAAAQNTTFNMVRSAATTAANCIPGATARVTINSLGTVEVMHMEASGLPPLTEFDAFVIQLPNAPFGLSWYQGDLTTDSNG